jgi:myo-inositol-1(or 4)-monophosphatase
MKKALTQRQLAGSLDFVIHLIQRVGDDILRRSRQDMSIAFKGEVDLVTQFDRSAQKKIVDALILQYPEYGILSEEGVDAGADRPARWIVDPLDGTTNFTHGLPIWAISIGLEVRGDVVLGAVYDPNRNELFSAIRDRGARLNGRKIHVSRTRKLDNSLLVTGFPYDIRRSDENNLRQFGAFAVRSRAVRRLGSAALDLCYTACGRFDGYWEMKLSPWDQAAGSLIVREAGGRITDFDGRYFDIYGDQVLATNGLIHRQMMRVLEQVRVGRGPAHSR